MNELNKENETNDHTEMRQQKGSQANIFSNK